MAISDELRAQILRYHFVERWRVGTIASQLGVHHYTVERVLSEAGVQRERQRRRRASKLDPYRAFITETLERFLDDSQPVLGGELAPGGLGHDFRVRGSPGLRGLGPRGLVALSSLPGAGASASISVIQSLSARIVIHLRLPPLIPRVAGVSTMLAERAVFLPARQ